MNGRRLRTAALALLSVVFVALAAGSSAPASGARSAATGAAGMEERYGEAFLYDGGGPDTYAAKLNGWRKQGYKDVPPGVSVGIEAADYTAASPDAALSVSALEGESRALKWESGGGYAEYRFRVPESGLYRLSVTYFPLAGKDRDSRADIIRTLTIDGALPFEEARLVTMKRLWKDDPYPPLRDEYGNEIRPKQEQLREWIEWDVSDYMNEYPEPHRFYLEKGEHVMRLEGVQEEVAFARFVFRSPEPIPSYADVKEAYEREAKGQNPFLAEIQAERMERKSDPVVQIAMSAESSVRPEALDTIVYNMMGGWKWGRRGAWAEWTFEVPADGYYTIAPVYEQQFVRGRNVFRTVSVDGKVPYRELLEVPFRYGDWQGGPLADGEGDAMLFKLSQGKHTLRMRVNVSPHRPALDAVESAIVRLRGIGDDVRAATGVANDSLIDKGMNWRLDESIPDLGDRLNGVADDLRRTRDYLTELHGDKLESGYSFTSLIRDLETFKADPNKLVNSLQRFGSVQEQLSAMVSGLTEQPLHLDRIYVATPQQKLPPFKATWWGSVKSSLSRFVLTFTGNFAAQGRNDKDAIDVWVQRGRDYVNLIQEMVDQEFTPQTGIKVNVNLMPNPQMLILGNAAGIQPDVALGLAEGTPIDFAMRNALVNLNRFPDYAQVSKRFLPGALMPFHYDGGDWALPEVQSFNMMFYRKDVLKKLNVSVPQTWDDVYALLPTLQQNRMNFYLPPEDLLPFLYQRGGGYYSPDGLRSGLDKPEAFEAFRQLTDFFVVYGLDRQANFYQHFRYGTMPIGIADLNTYLLLTVAAPELTGQWAIAPIPGTPDGKGRIARWAGGALQSGVIFRSSDRQDDAWQFLKWWTSDTVQTQFGVDLETINGLEYRWNTANMNAFRRQMWPKEDLDRILEQLRWYKDVPRVPGEYFTDRQYKFAWNRTVVDGDSSRDALETAAFEINKELLRKQREFGFVDGTGRTVRTLDVPDVSEPWDGRTGGDDNR
ncbi:extracellular solute-binding protein [Paenibacillus flagellatus]|uniref:extracellular solute-binding protein n=1 Tax=Paenibacillus flagellatus TaxID=2211139 RepID=UPI00130539A8|nr:extracellular solute-binding protein [Paenibacillus flagellatus]